MRKSTVFLSLGAIIFVAAAAAGRFVVVPALKQLPANLDTTVYLSGTATVLNPAALLTGDLPNLLKTNVPVTVAEHVKVLSTSNGTAVVSDETTVSGPDKSTIQQSKRTWAVDRKTLLEAPAPTGSTVQPHEGLAFGFPLTPEAHNYPYWDSVTQTAGTATYDRAEAYQGRDTYVYVVHAAGAVKDPDILKVMPPVVPKTTLLAFAATMGPAVQQSLAAFAGALPDQIPLSLSSTSDTSFWVDKATGYVLNVTRKQTVQAGITVAGASVPLAAVFALDAAYTPETVSAAKADADKAQQGLFLIGTIVPACLLGLGVLLLILAVLLGIRRGRRADPPPADEPVTGDPPPADEPVTGEPPVEAEPTAVSSSSPPTD